MAVKLTREQREIADNITEVVNHSKKWNMGTCLSASQIENWWESHIHKLLGMEEEGYQLLHN